MSGNVWSVEWSPGDADTVRRDLIELGRDSPCQCGPAGATWRVLDWSELTEGRIGAVLLAIDPHTINPAARVIELLMPAKARP